MSSAAGQQLAPIDVAIAQVRSASFLEQLEAALPENVSVDRFARVTATALRENPDLAKTTRESLFSAIVKCAQDGLLPDGREAALVKFKDQTAYLPMIGGYRKIAAEHGWSIRTAAVHAADQFDYELGDNESVRHRPALTDRGALVACYAIGTHADGRRLVEIMGPDDVAKAKSVARTQAVWNEWTDRMWEKTVGKRLFAKLPLADARAERVVQASELGPEEASAMLYGPSGDAVGTVRELRSAAVEPEPTAEPEDAGPPEDEPEPAEAEVVDEPEFEGDEPSQEEPAAEAVRFTSGDHQGKTIAEVAAADPAYLAWAAKRWSAEPVKSAVRAYVEAHPEVVDAA